MKQFFTAFFICISLFCADTFAQGAKAIDSLRNVYQTAKNDTIKALALASLAYSWKNTNPDTAYHLATEAQVLAQKTKNQRAIMMAAMAVGGAQFARSFFDEANTHYEKAMNLAIALHDTTTLMLAYNNIAGVNNMKGRYAESLEFYQKSYKLSEEKNLLEGACAAMTNIGGLYRLLNKFDLAEEYLLKASELAEKGKNKMSLSNIYNTLGIIESERKDFDKALSYFLKALKLSQETNYKRALPLFNCNVAQAYYKKGEDSLARHYYNKAIELAEAHKDRRAKSYILNGMAEFYMSTKDYDKVIASGKTMLEMAQIMKSPSEERMAYELLIKGYKGKGDYESVLNYYEKERAIRDSLFNTESAKAIANLESSAALEKKQKELALLAKDKELSQVQIEIQAKQMAIAQKQAEADKLFAMARHESDKRKSDSLLNLAQRRQYEADVLRSEEARLKALNQAEIIENQKHKKEKAFQRTLLYLGLLGLVIIALFAFYAYRKNLIQKSLNQKLVIQSAFIGEQNKNLEQQNHEIRQGIRAATMIQNAVLPFDSRIKNYFTDYFVIFLPQNIVSGDFYWIQKIEQKTYVVVADCTGHGVQGAFMSLIGINILERIVPNIDAYRAGEVLNKMNELLQNTLKNDEAFLNNGMDAAILIIDEPQDGIHLVEYAGAHRALHFVLAGSTRIERVAATRRAIGGKLEANKAFETTQLSLPPKSQLYLSSDGLADQNNKEGKKLGEKAIFEVISPYLEKKMTLQKEAINQLLIQHSQDVQQRDDILFLGVRL